MKYKCEIQVRSLAQHIWAAASHKLQYKREASVPLPLRRTISRISALLETVDLEFDRVLSERQAYVSEAISTPAEDEPLNVDIVEKILDELLPPANKRGTEDYDEMLRYLIDAEIGSTKDLRKMVVKFKAAILEEDARVVKERQEAKDYKGTTKERVECGVFYTHAGLLRGMIDLKLGRRF